MQRVNIAAPAFEYTADDPAGYRGGMHRLGGLLGMTRTGMSVYELPPGQALCPYHYEYGEEEWLLVLEGRPSVRHPGGVEELAPWDVVAFTDGPAGAHQVRNDADVTARVLMFSNRVEIGASVYPDSDKIGIWPPDKADQVMVQRSSHVDYFTGETG